MEKARFRIVFSQSLFSDKICTAIIPINKPAKEYRFKRIRQRNETFISQMENLAMCMSGLNAQTARMLAKEK